MICFAYQCIAVWDHDSMPLSDVLFVQIELETLQRKPVCFIITGKPVSERQW